MSNGDDGFLPLPPTDVKVTDVVDHEVDPRQKAKLQALGQKDAGWFGNIWAHFWASAIDGMTYIVSRRSNPNSNQHPATSKQAMLAQRKGS